MKANDFNQNKKPLGRGRVFPASLLVVAVLLLFGLYQLYVLRNPQASLKFQLYEPAYLPEGLKITDPRLMVWSRGHSPWPYLKQFVVDLDRPESYLLVQAAKDYYDATCNALDAQADNVTCAMQTTAQGQTYRLTIITDGANRLWREEVLFIKGETVIDINIRNLHNQPTPAKEWSKVVDGYTKLHREQLEVRHAKPGP